MTGRDKIAAEAVGMLEGLLEYGHIPKHLRQSVESLLRRHAAARELERVARDELRALSAERRMLDKYRDPSADVEMDSTGGVNDRR